MLDIFYGYKPISLNSDAKITMPKEPISLRYMIEKIDNLIINMLTFEWL
jgi:hypothetical protein